MNRIEKKVILFVVLVSFGLCMKPVRGGGPADIYVAKNGDDSNNGLSWNSPVLTIQRGVDLAEEGDIVLVSNGLYSTGGRVASGGGAITNRVCIEKRLTLRSVNGPDTVFVSGMYIPMGPKAVRCLYISSGYDDVYIEGITLMNGGTLDDDVGLNSEAMGGGVRVYLGGATISNCCISYCKAGYRGGGLSAPPPAIGQDLNTIVVDSKIVSCTAKKEGGAANRVKLVNSYVVANTAYELGGGLHHCEAYNCVFSNNYSYSCGGASYYSDLYNCLLIENNATVGGGIYGGLVNGCTLINNVATNNSNNGCGAYHAYSTNSIFWSSDHLTQLYDMQGVYYSCSPDGVTEGVNHNITSDPQFVDAANGDFRLNASSPCVNAGLTSAAYTLYGDLLGNTRVQNGTVDMGAYERNLADLSPLFLLLSN